MNLELNFKQLCDIVKNENDSEALRGSIDKVLDFLKICSPLVPGFVASAYISTLGTVTDLTRVGKEIFSAISNDGNGNYRARLDRLRMAHGLLVFTSFFETLDRVIPPEWLSIFTLAESEKVQLAKASLGRIDDKVKPDSWGDDTEYVAQKPISFPHPNEPFEAQIEKFKVLWEEMTHCLRLFVDVLLRENPGKYPSVVDIPFMLYGVIPECADCYRAQYLELTRIFPEFAFWANIEEHHMIQHQLLNVSSAMEDHFQWLQSIRHDVDIGMSRIGEMLRTLPSLTSKNRGEEIFIALDRHYQAKVREPIAKPDLNEEGGPSLAFPRICDSFIPQKAKALRKNRDSGPLGDEETWKYLETRDDLSRLLLSLTTSPHSFTSPILVLGHPGSGKSLLTIAFSAQMMANGFTVIRIPLRDVPADAKIPEQIEAGIQSIARTRSETWISLAEKFIGHPPLVILDGYDELLQSSGKTFANYLMDVQAFQKEEADQGRPVCVLVTSRLTLISMANVPDGTEVIRLLDFDPFQASSWSRVWNRTNAGYFKNSGVEEFSLPFVEEDEEGKFRSLAKQPLMLLMLAIFDSQRNQLREIVKLNRTTLYDSLLHRFLVRECSKEPDFLQSPLSEREKVLEASRNRLWILAMGMFNRRKLHILSHELSKDLKYFGADEQGQAKSSRALEESEKTLGGFFFIHRSIANYSKKSRTGPKSISAFEFLHNTFGEFLTADYIIRCSIREIGNRTPPEGITAREIVTETNRAVSKEWLSCLTFSSLASRPVILEMMREWIDTVLNEQAQEKKTFELALDALVTDQIKKILVGTDQTHSFLPTPPNAKPEMPFERLPWLGHSAIYSMNLLLLRLAANGTSIVFEENHMSKRDDGIRPWDCLINLWKTWFSLETLHGISSIFSARRDGSRIVITSKMPLQSPSGNTRLERFASTSIALGDGLATGVLDLLGYPRQEGDPCSFSELDARLTEEGLAEGSAYLLRKLQAKADCGGKDSYSEFLSLASECFSRILFEGNRATLEKAITLYIQRCPQPPETYDGSVSIEAKLIANISSLAPKACTSLIQFQSKQGNWWWVQKIRGEVIDTVLREIQSGLQVTRSEEDWVRILPRIVDLLGLVREMGDFEKFDSIGHNTFTPSLLEAGLNMNILLQLDAHCARNFLEFLDRWVDTGGFGNLSPILLRKIFERADFRSFMSLLEKSPKAALAYFGIINKVIDVDTRKDFPGAVAEHEIFSRGINPRYLWDLEVIEQGDGCTLVTLAMIVGTSAYRKALGRVTLPDEFYFKAAGGFIDLFEKNPKCALDSLELILQFEGKWSSANPSAIEMFHTLFKRILYPNTFLELIRNDPELALRCLDLAGQLTSENVLMLYSDIYMDKLSRQQTLMSLMGEHPIRRKALAHLGTILQKLSSSGSMKVGS